MMVNKLLAELEQYRPALTTEPDYDAFWAQTVAESDAQPLNATLEEVAYPVDRVKLWSLRYDGFGLDTRVAGWYITPQEGFERRIGGKVPTIIIFHGYTGNKGRPWRFLQWALQGYRVLTIDTRGQNGDTPDNNKYSSGYAIGHLSKGLLDPSQYYYRYAYMDCVRVVDFARTQPETGPIIVTGGSQGGGLTLATAALAREKGIVAAMPDIPFLCDFRRSLADFTVSPYDELIQYWRINPQHIETGLRTLSYFDGMNFASHITCPTLISVGLQDPTCPPASAFAVYNHLAGRKEIKVYPYLAHEVFDEHYEEQYRFAIEVLLHNVE